jgi:uncharacterized protein YecE (DUF72 family)
VPLLVGTSGWQYRDWRGTVYPVGLPQREWLGWYSARFATVEVNATFYRLAEVTTFERWAATVPDDFVLAVKMSRFLTHLRRLRDPAEPVARFFDRATALGHRLGPVLVQLPPDQRSEPDRLRALLEVWPEGRRLAFEPRHRSWFTPEVERILAEHGVALVRTDRRGRRLEPPWVTADWGYVRLHEGTASPWPSYGDRALRSWVERIAAGWPDEAEVFVYFDNDPGGCAATNAIRFAALARRAGRTVTRTPDHRELGCVAGDQPRGARGTP